MLLGGRLVEMQEEEEEEEEEKAPCRGSVMEGRDGLVAAWLEAGGRRGFARSYRGQRYSLNFLLFNDC